MPQEPRIQQLLERLMDSGTTPEEVCADSPELLAQVRDHWERMRVVEAQLDQLFPTPNPARTSRFRPLSTHRLDAASRSLPQIPGYQCDSILGTGGMGVVYKARHLKLNRTVAIKMLLAGDFATPQEFACLLREAQAVAALHHANIIQVHDVGDLEGLPYFTMEFLEGGTLASKLAGVPQPSRDAAALIVTLAGAMQAAHQSGIVHRDLKPSNILLCADGTPKITDFGLARRVQTDSAVTIAGTILGTPSYMAPEQADGTASGFCPAVDIYSLGAILYEALTGRPPFRAANAVETRRQVLEQEAVPPSRLNAQIPRDLETICLKCLHKEPDRRYLSAETLAEDLHRYLRGEPVLARSVSTAEKALKWARRRPAAAGLLIVVIGVLVSAAGVTIWYQNILATHQAENAVRQARAQQMLENALSVAESLRSHERWEEGLRTLQVGDTPVVDAASDSLQKRLQIISSDLVLGGELERVRQSRVNPALDAIDLQAVERDYERVFATIALNILAEPERGVEYIRASAIHTQLLSALDDWAYVCFDLHNLPRAESLLAIARKADPDPLWRDRFRTISIWSDRSALSQLAEDAGITSATGSPSEQAKASPQQLGLLGVLLARKGAPAAGTDLLTSLFSRHPDDFWVCWELGHALRNDNKPADAIAVFSAAIALRPNNVFVCNTLAVTLHDAGRFEDSIAMFRRAIDLAPRMTIARHNLLYMYVHAGHWRDARALVNAAMAADPHEIDLPIQLVADYVMNSKYEDAMEMVRTIITIVPWSAGSRDTIFNAQGELGLCLAELKQYSEAEAIFRDCITKRPDQSTAYAWLGRVAAKTARFEESIAHFQLALAREPQAAAYYTEYGEVLHTLHRDREALDAFTHALKLDPEYLLAWQGNARTELSLGNFTQARDAAKGLVARVSNADTNSLLDLSERMLTLSTSYPPIAGSATEYPTPTAPSDQCVVAHWLAKYSWRPAAASALFTQAFTKEPALLNSNAYRRIAAAAAASAGCGLGSDAATLSESDRTQLRARAFAWCTQEKDSLKALTRNGAPPGTTDLASTAAGCRDMLQTDFFACVRDEAAISTLPATEQQQWRDFWADVAACAARDPAQLLSAARKLASNSHWKDSASTYAQMFALERNSDSEAWFEYAAVQLLAGDRAGYLHTCQEMIDSIDSPTPFRQFLIARACTLDPQTPGLAARVALISDAELRRAADRPWSLAEQGALRYRKGDATGALPLLDRCAAANARPGAISIACLWKAMANHKLGEMSEARRLLTKASLAIDPLSDEIPPDALKFDWHLHNWIEAQILLREARTLILPPTDEQNTSSH